MSEEDKDGYRKINPNERDVFTQEPTPQPQSHFWRNVIGCVTCIILILLFGPMILTIIAAIATGTICQTFG